MSELERLAPRLARAHLAEVRYQQRKAASAKRGWIPADIAYEEMARSIRALARSAKSPRKLMLGPR